MFESAQARRRRLTVPMCVDVEIRSRADWEQAQWLRRMKRFYCKHLKATVRVVFLSPYKASLEILRF